LLLPLHLATAITSWKPLFGSGGGHPLRRAGGQLRRKLVVIADIVALAFRVPLLRKSRSPPQHGIPGRSAP
jgi:hypothetical protein